MHDEGGAAGLAVHRVDHAVRIETGERIVRRDQFARGADLEAQQLGLRRGHRILPHHLLVQNDEIIGDDVLHAAIEGARLRRPFQDRGENRVERREQGVLVADPQRQQAVEEGVHRRHVVGTFQVPVAVEQSKPRLSLEGFTVHRLDVAEVQGDVEGLQGAVRPRALEIVLGAEKAVAGGAPLPRVKAPRLSSRRAMVEVNRFSPWMSVVTGRNSGAQAWLVRCERPRPWMAASARQPGSTR